MSWYYAVGSEQKGPVGDDVLATLVNQGAVTGDTLVWREGMPNWQPYREISAAGAPGEPPALTSVVCSQCGKTIPSDEVIRIGGGPVCITCKPVALQKLREGVGTGDAAEEVRKAHIKHEASVKSVGILYLLGACFLLFAGLFSFIGILAEPGATGKTEGLIGGFVLAGLGGVQFATGLGQRRLRPWTRVPVGILFTLGLCAIPVGTLINIYVLWLVFSEKGKTVLSEEYQGIIAATPHIKYKTSVIVWIALGLLILLFALALVGMLLASVKH